MNFPLLLMMTFIIMSGVFGEVKDSALTRSPDTTSFYQQGQYFDRDGPRFIIRRTHFQEVHALFLGDLLEKIPGLIYTRQSFLGTLSDLKSPGVELYGRDATIALFVDDMEAKQLDASRLYMNNISLSDVDYVIVEPSGSNPFSRVGTVIRVYTRDHHFTDAATNILWENGPFDANVFKFAFGRRLGYKTGLYVGTEKCYMFENLGFSSLGPSSYSHPGPITDIYRSFLQRSPDQYVTSGYRFENDLRNWDVKLSTQAFPGGLFCAGFEYFADKQDDYRDLSDSSGIVNAGTKRQGEKYYLIGRSIAWEGLELSGNCVLEKQRLLFVDSDFTAASADTSNYFRQGNDTRNLRIQADWKQGWLPVKTTLSESFETWQGRRFTEEFRTDKLETTLQPRLPAWGIPLRLELTGTVDHHNQRDAFLLSPGVLLQGGLSAKLDGYIQYNCRRWFPSPNLQYFDNPRFNTDAEGISFRRSKAYCMASGVSARFGSLSTSYQVEDWYTVDPVLLVIRQEENGRKWAFTQDSILHDQRTVQSLFLEYALGHWRISNTASAARLVTGGDRFKTVWSFQGQGSLSLTHTFMEGRLLSNATLTCRYRPGCWVPDYYILNGSGLVQPLNGFLAFDLDFYFTIKTFTMIARFQNLSDQIISYEPGYHLPGPLVRWGIEWHFGN